MARRRSESKRASSAANVREAARSGSYPVSESSGNTSTETSHDAAAATASAWATRFPEAAPRAAVAAFANLDELTVVAARLRAIAGRFCRTTGAVHRSESIRLSLQVGLEFLQGGRGLIRFEQHLAEQLVRRRDWTGRDRRLVGRIFERRRSGQRPQRVLFPAFGPERPSLRRLALDVELRGPVRVFGLDFFFAQRDQLLDLGFREVRFTRSRGAERAREAGDRFDER